MNGRKILILTTIALPLYIAISSGDDQTQSQYNTMIRQNGDSEKEPYSGPANVPDFRMILQGGDRCEDATIIESIPYQDDGTTTGYNHDYGVMCPYGSNSPDVVYAYTPPSAQTIDISLCGGITNYDTQIFVFENICDESGLVACNDDACSAPQYQYPFVSRVENLEVLPSSTYYFVVDGYNGAYGDYTIEIAESPPPFDGLCADTPDVLWNNGDTDGSNGLSMQTDPYRSLLADFVVPEGGWTISEFRQTIIWNSGGGPLATGYDLIVWNDNNAQPGEPIITLNTSLIQEMPTGRIWFSRDEYLITVAIEDQLLPPGSYWLEMRIIGPENCFALAITNDGVGSEIIGEPIWLCYEDFPPCPSIGCTFGFCYDINFCLSGSFCDDYTIGDYNGNSQFNVADIIAAFSMLSSGSPVASLLCRCPPEGEEVWPVAMDLNNSCTFNIADVIVGFSNLQTGQPGLTPCELCPPSP